MLKKMLRTGAMAVIAALSLASMVSAQSCNKSLDGYRLDWSSQSWGSGNTTGTYSVPKTSNSSETSPVKLTFSGSTNRFLSGYPIGTNKFTGGYGSSERSLAYAVDFSNNSQSITLTIDFAKAVSDLKFEMFDVDSLAASDGAGGFRDGLKLTGTGPSGSVLPTLSKRASNSTIWLGNPLQSNWALGYYGNSDDLSANGTLYVSFPSPVTSVTIIYTNDIYPPSDNPAPQGVSIHDLDFCIPTEAADVTASKSQLIHSHTPVGCDLIPGSREAGAEYALPGACVEYVITATNKGAGVADQVTLTDILDSRLIFRNAAHSGFSNGGASFGLTTPAPQRDCASSQCTIALRDAKLSPGQTGSITIRATIK